MLAALTKGITKICISPNSNFSTLKNKKKFVKFES